MRKNIKKFAGIVLCIGMFTGCAQTPDSSLVKPKGSKAVDAYTEADDVSGSKGEASESKNDDGSESKTTIRNLIDAPQNYKSHVEDDSAKLVVNTDASVEIPEVEKISAISVTAAEVTQELLDRITNAFFSEAKLYTMDSYYVKTKDEIKKTLDELKEDVANGNLDPYNYGTDDDGNYVYDIYEDIETWEQEYETAPEKKTLTEAKPVAGNYFSCIAQMPDDSQYYYMISSDGSDTLSVKIKKAANKGGEKIPEDAMWCDYGYSEEEEKPTEESIGLSLDEAKKLVKEKVEKMGITDLQFSNWNYAVCKSFEGDNSSDGHLVGAALQDPVEVIQSPDAAPHRQGDEDLAGHRPENVRKEIAALGGGGDVIKDQLVGAGCIVEPGHLHRVRHVPQPLEVGSLDYPAVLHIQAGNDAFG